MEEHKIKLTVDTGTSNKDLEKLSQALHDVDEEIVPLTSIMGDLEDKLMLMAHAGDTTSEEFKKMAQEAASMRKTIRLTDEGIEAMSMTTSQKLGGALGGIASGFEMAQGVMATFGANSQQVEEALLKVQSAMALAQGAQGLKEASNSFKALGASASSAFSSMSSGAKAFAVTGIGALIAGVALLVTNFDKLQGLFDKTSERQKVLNSTMDAYASGAGEAKMQTDKVALAFEQAKKGVISKQEALKTYNDELGSTMGKQTDINAAEENFVKKSKAYTDAAALRAQAQAVMKLAADEYAQSLKDQYTDQRNTTEKTGILVSKTFSSIIDYTTGGYTDLNKKSKELDDETYKNAFKRSKAANEKRQQLLKDEYSKLLNEAENISKKYGLMSDADNEAADAIAQKEAERLEKIKEANAKAAEDKKAALERIKQAEKEYQDSLKTDQELERQLIYEKYQALIADAEKYGQSTIELENAYKSELNDVKVKYAQIEIDNEKAKNEKLAQEAEQANQKRIQDEDAQFALDQELEYKRIEIKDGIDAANKARERDALIKSYEDKFAIAGENHALEMQLTEQQKLELDALDQKYSDIAKERKKRDREQSIDAARSGFELIGNLAVQFAGKSRKQQEKAFKIQKAANIATATIDTYKAAVSAYASAGNPIVGAVFMAIAIAAGIANIAKISKTKFDAGGEGGGSGTISADSGGGGTASAMTPQFNIVGNNPMNQLAQLQTQPVRAYVVSGEVSTAQSLDRNRVQNATL